MKIEFKIDKNKSVGYSIKFDNDDEINGRQGLALVAHHIINSLSNT